MYKWKDERFIDDRVTDYLNRSTARFDPATDPGYRQYRDQYLKLGQQVSADTAQMVDQLAGGYDNTYAQAVGNQAYQRYVSKLHNAIPAYQSAAMTRNSGSADKILNDISLSQKMQNRANPGRASVNSGLVTMAVDSIISAGNEITRRPMTYEEFQAAVEANPGRYYLYYTEDYRDGEFKPTEYFYDYQAYLRDWNQRMGK